MVRTGTLQERHPGQPKAIMGGVASGVGILEITGFLANRIVPRGRWAVLARPVSGPGLDDPPRFRGVVRSRKPAEALAAQWARRLQSGESLVEG
jgi:hypothetical protein